MQFPCIVVRLSVLVVSSWLLIGCSNEFPPSATSLGTSNNEQNQANEPKTSLTTISIPRTIRGTLCHDINISNREPVMVDGSIVGELYQQEFQYSNCMRGEWPRDVLDGFRDGEFTFPIGILSDPAVRFQMFLDENHLSPKFGVGSMVMALYGKYDLSSTIKVNMSIEFCEMASVSACGFNSWNEEFVQVSLRRRPSTESGTDDLLVVKFSSDVGGTN